MLTASALGSFSTVSDKHDTHIYKVIVLTNNYFIKCKTNK